MLNYSSKSVFQKAASSPGSVNCCWENWVNDWLLTPFVRFERAHHRWPKENFKPQSFALVTLSNRIMLRLDIGGLRCSSVLAQGLVEIVGMPSESWSYAGCLRTLDVTTFREYDLLQRMVSSSWVDWQCEGFGTGHSLWESISYASLREVTTVEIRGIYGKVQGEVVNWLLS